MEQHVDQHQCCLRRVWRSDVSRQDCQLCEERAMGLKQPVVVGPASELSSSIRVKNQLVGATVSVESATRTVAKGIATSGDQRFALLSGVKLSRYETLYAVQHIGSDQSDVPSINQRMAVAPGPSTSADFGL